MDLKDIQELIKFVAKSGATEVSLEIDNIKISIKSPAKKKRGDNIILAAFGGGFTWGSIFIKWAYDSKK